MLLNLMSLPLITWINEFFPFFFMVLAIERLTYSHKPKIIVQDIFQR